MEFTKEEKMAFVKRYQEGESVIRICNETQIPRSTFYRWIQDYQQTVTDTGTVVTPQAFQHLKRKAQKLEVNSTPPVRYYIILSNKWGAVQAVGSFY